MDDSLIESPSLVSHHEKAQARWYHA